MPDKSSLPGIHFHFMQKSAYPRDRQMLKAFIRSLLKREKTAFISLTYIFCSDEYLLGINQQFLKHNYYTDIISFNLASKKDPVEGEIYISLDRVRDNANGLNIPYKSELHRVIFHGALHLCGYKDKSAADIKMMRGREDLYLKLYLNS